MLFYRSSRMHYAFVRSYGACDPHSVLFLKLQNPISHKPNGISSWDKNILKAYTLGQNYRRVFCSFYEFIIEKKIKSKFTRFYGKIRPLLENNSKTINVVYGN